MFARATALSLSLSFGLLAFGESAYVLSYFNDLPEGGRRGEAAVATAKRRVWVG